MENLGYLTFSPHQASVAGILPTFFDHYKVKKVLDQATDTGVSFTNCSKQIFDTLKHCIFHSRLQLEVGFFKNKKLHFPFQENLSIQYFYIP